MTKVLSSVVMGAIFISGAVAFSGSASAQSRIAPAGSALANTPPINQRAKQFRALPRNQQRFYLRQGYKRHVRPY